MSSPEAASLLVTSSYENRVGHIYIQPPLTDGQQQVLIEAGMLGKAQEVSREGVGEDAQSVITHEQLSPDNQHFEAMLEIRRGQVELLLGRSSVLSESLDVTVS